MPFLSHVRNTLTKSLSKKMRCKKGWLKNQERNRKRKMLQTFSSWLWWEMCFFLCDFFTVPDGAKLETTVGRQHMASVLQHFASPHPQGQVTEIWWTWCKLNYLGGMFQTWIKISEEKQRMKWNENQLVQFSMKSQKVQ